MNEVRYVLPTLAEEQDPFVAVAMIDYWIERLYFRTFLRDDVLNEIKKDCKIFWTGISMKGATSTEVVNMLLDARSMHMNYGGGTDETGD